MSAQPSIRAAELRRLLSPLLTLASPEAETRMGKTVGEGLVLPDAEGLLKQALPKEATKGITEETVEWIRQVLRPVWLVPDLGTRLFAVPRAVNGEDAFIGGWTIKNQPFQVVVTRERVHLLTRLKDSSKEQDSEEKARRAVALAFGLLQIPGMPDPGQWRTRPFGGLLLGTREVGDFAREWYETLLFLTDGRGFKFSVLKYKGRTSPPKRGGPRTGPVPWFSQ